MTHSPLRMAARASGIESKRMLEVVSAAEGVGLQRPTFCIHYRHRYDQPASKHACSPPQRLRPEFHRWAGRTRRCGGCVRWLSDPRLLQRHPNCHHLPGCERSAGKRWSEICPFLPLLDDPVVETPDPARIAETADFAVLSLPNGLASDLVPDLLERGVRVVDLSADYRYRSLEEWPQVSCKRPRRSAN